MRCSTTVDALTPPAGLTTTKQAVVVRTPSIVLAVAPLVGVPRLIGAVPAIRAALDV